MKKYELIDYLCRKGIIDNDLHEIIYRYYQCLDKKETSSLLKKYIDDDSEQINYYDRNKSSIRKVIL